jgi:hypothetical protein
LKQKKRRSINEEFMPFPLSLLLLQRLLYWGFRNFFFALLLLIHPLPKPPWVEILSVDYCLCSRPSPVRFGPLCFMFSVLQWTNYSPTTFPHTGPRLKSLNPFSKTLDWLEKEFSSLNYRVNL